MKVLANRLERPLKEATKVLMEKFGNLISEDEPLAAHNTFGTGGKARLFANVCSTKELAAVVHIADELKIPYFMLGGGSNMLISDEGYNGLIIKNSIGGIQLDGTEITVGAGVELQRLVDFATEHGLSGLEFAAGIWGTVGGAIFGNAGAYGSEIGSVLKWAELVDRKGEVRVEPATYFEFDYRTSKLKKTREFVARAGIVLRAGDKTEIAQKVQEILKTRKDKLPETEHSAGCFFKNIPDRREKFGKLTAGKLLEEIGAKEMRVGGAYVYYKHANIIINDGTANSQEIRRLAETLKKKVKEKFGIELAEEITFLGDFKEEKI